MAGSGVPEISIVVPVRDAAATLEPVLRALHRARPSASELIVVDDSSRDDSAAIAHRFADRVISLGQPVGPAGARNAGAAAARGSWLAFIDADSEVHPDAFTWFTEIIGTDPEVDAVFGSYDDGPPDAGLVSVVKNLQHHHVHQRAARDAVTFWTGLGFVRRSVFQAVGGFDAGRYPHPAVEDIDVGYRMSRAGHAIRLEPRMQATHLKIWSLRSVLTSTIFDRGVPWTHLLLEHGTLRADLNLRHRSRAAGVASVVAVASLGCFARRRRARLGGLIGVSALAVVVACDADFLRLLARRRGSVFALRSVPLLWLLHFAAVVGLAIGSITAPWDARVRRGVLAGRRRGAGRA